MLRTSLESGIDAPVAGRRRRLWHPLDVERTGSFGVREAVALLSAGTGEAYELVRRLAGGETGAHEIVGPDNRRLVLKWELDPSSIAARRRAVELTGRLRGRAGWPVPEQQTVEVDGCLLVTQELLVGDSVEKLTHSLVDRLLDLHSRRLGLARREDGSQWPARLVETLTTGGAGYCLHEPLRTFDDRTARLVAAVERLGTTLDPGDLAGQDLVHWDWHPGNLLQDDGALAAVVDNDFVTTGDASFDLVTLALTSLTIASESGVAELLFSAAFDDLDEPRREAYLAHLFIRLLDWSIRRGRGDEIEFWLGQAGRLLRL